MTKKEIEELKRESWRLWKQNRLDEAIEIIRQLEKSRIAKGDFNFNLISSSCLNDRKFYSLAVRFLKRATKLKPSNELASNFLFVNLVSCKAFNLAMSELNRFLKKYPAKNYYRVTLHELLSDLQKGNATNWEDQIIYFSKLNRIQIGRFYPKYRLREKRN